jgi:signal transduction histidine kinase
MDSTRTSGRNPSGEQTANFEALLAEMSTTFRHVTVDQLDGEIDGWLRRLALALGIDRSAVAEFDVSREVLSVRHQWAREGLTPTSLHAEVRQFAPWLAEKILADELVSISRLDELPRDAALDVKYARRTGLQSNFTVPLKVGGRIVGAAGFGTIFSQRQWSHETVRHLKLVAEVFCNALERKRAASEIRDLREEIERMSRVMTMTEVTAALAHELNQPLGAILNYAQAARRFLSAKTPNLREVRKALDQIVSADARAVDVIHNIRTLFQRGEPTMSPIDLPEVLLVVEHIMSPEARRRKISLSIEVPPSLPDVIGQRTQLVQVLVNLVVNAFDSISEAEAGRREVIISAARHEDDVHVSVCDSGKGIDPEILPNLFRAFTTTKPNGIGMGLAIARSIIEKHGGRLWADQNPDRGATVKLSLPSARSGKRRPS